MWKVSFEETLIEVINGSSKGFELNHSTTKVGFFACLFVVALASLSILHLA